MSSIEERVNEQDIKLAKIETLLEGVALNMDKMANSMVKQEVILEKLSNLETNMEGTVQRIHHRIDMNEQKLKQLDAAKADKHYAARTQKICDELEPIRLLTKFPKLTAIVLFCMYLLTIKEVRDAIIPLAGVVG